MHISKMASLKNEFGICKNKQESNCCMPKHAGHPQSKSISGQALYGMGTRFVTRFQTKLSLVSTLDHHRDMQAQSHWYSTYKLETYPLSSISNTTTSLKQFDHLQGTQRRSLNGNCYPESRQLKRNSGSTFLGHLNPRGSPPPETNLRL